MGQRHGAAGVGHSSGKNHTHKPNHGGGDHGHQMTAGDDQGNQEPPDDRNGVYGVVNGPYRCLPHESHDRPSENTDGDLGRDDSGKYVRQSQQRKGHRHHADRQVGSQYLGQAEAAGRTGYENHGRDRKIYGHRLLGDQGQDE